MTADAATVLTCLALLPSSFLLGIAAERYKSFREDRRHDVAQSGHRRHEDQCSQIDIVDPSVDAHQCNRLDRDQGKKCDGIEHAGGKEQVLRVEEPPLRDVGDQYKRDDLRCCGALVSRKRDIHVQIVVEKS